MVWSGLESTTELSHGKHTGGIHFDAKAEVTAHAKAIGVPFVNVSAATYMQTYLETLAPRKQADGSYLMATVGAPSSTLPLIDVQDYGLFVRKALETPGDQEIFAYGEVISLGQVTEQLAQCKRHATFLLLLEELILRFWKYRYGKANPLCAFDARAIHRSAEGGRIDGDVHPRGVECSTDHD